MQKMFIQRMLFFIVVAAALTMTIAFFMQTWIARNNAEHNAHVVIKEINKKIGENDQEIIGIMESLNERGIEKAKILAYLIMREPAILENADMMRELRATLNVDGICVSDQNGVLRWGTDYIGFDMNSTEQSRAFMPALTDSSFVLAQMPQFNGAKGMMTQYIGVGRRDQPGIIQVEMYVERLDKAMDSNKIKNVLSAYIIGSHGYFIAVDKRTGTITAHKNEAWIGKDASRAGLPAAETGSGFMLIDDCRFFYVTGNCGDYTVYAMLPESELYQDRALQLLLFFAALILIFALLVFLINLMLRELIISGIERLEEAVEQITEGNLKLSVDIRNTEEFKRLSNGINLMAQSIKREMERTQEKARETEQLLQVQKKYQELLHEATEGLYYSVCEFDVSGNRIGSESTKQYFQGLGLNRDASYDEVLEWVSQHQIKPEYVGEYLKLLSRPAVLAAYERGERNLSYDFMITFDGESYHWMQLSAQICLWEYDHSVRLITYRKIIDDEKHREEALLEKSIRDSLTGFYNKRTTENMISSILEQSCNGEVHALVILDIDNFKTVNDSHGHAFGDFIITELAETLKAQFLDEDILGRIGGDEFVVLIKNYQDIDVLKNKLERFCDRLKQKDYGKERENYHISCSIGVALFPAHGSSYPVLYEKADQALYYTKGHGKNNFHLFGELFSGACFHVNQRDLDALIDVATHGIAKIAYADQLKLLYFNQKWAALTGSPATILASPEFDVLGQVHHEDKAGLLDMLAKAVPGRNPFMITLRLYHDDGRYIRAVFKGLFVQEMYNDVYPIFYVICTEIVDEDA